MKITKGLCDNVINILNAEGKHHKDGWIGVLNDATNIPDLRESVGALSYIIFGNEQTFSRVARQMLPKYMEAHPEVKDATMALNILTTQLMVRMIVYIFKHAKEVEELGDMFDMDFVKKEKE